MIALNDHKYKYMTKVNRVDTRETRSGKVYTVIYAEFIDEESCIKTKETILLDEYGHPIEIPSEIPDDVLISMKLVKTHMYY